MPPAKRAFLESLHAQYFPRANGGMVYPLEGLVCHLLGAGRHGVADEQVARALGVPVPTPPPGTPSVKLKLTVAR
jgi:hypothetical protein